MSGPVSEMVGNALCLDFVNTVNSRPIHTRDDLAAPESAWRWASSAGLEVVPAQHALAGDRRDLAALRLLRDSVHAVFSAIAGGREPGADDIAGLVAVHGTALRAAHWLWGDRGMTPTWPAVRRLRDVRGPVSDSAVALLRSGPLERVGECPGCGWLFLDRSRNGLRRWCSMDTCGSRDKTARYDAKTRDLAQNR